MFESFVRTIISLHMLSTHRYVQDLIVLPVKLYLLTLYRMELHEARKRFLLWISSL